MNSERRVQRVPPRCSRPGEPVPPTGRSRRARRRARPGDLFDYEGPASLERDPPGLDARRRHHQPTHRSAPAACSGGAARHGPPGHERCTPNPFPGIGPRAELRAAPSNPRPSGPSSPNEEHPRFRCSSSPVAPPGTVQRGDDDPPVARRRGCRPDRPGRGATPRDAASLGVAEGGAVRVTSRYGEATVAGRGDRTCRARASCSARSPTRRPR